MKQTGLAPILIVLIIAVIGLGGFLLYSSMQKAPPKKGDYATITPYKSPAASQDDWKTFTNTTYSYNIKYPLEVTVQSGSQQTEAEKASAIEIVTNLGKPAYQIATIQIVKPEIERDPKVFLGQSPIPKMSDLTLKDFTEKLWTINKDSIEQYPGKTVSSLDETNINGYKGYAFTVAVEYDHPSGGGETLGEERFSYIEKDGEIYIFRAPTNNKILNEVISTFKFTN